jgi:PAS domain S-box-containing protein
VYANEICEELTGYKREEYYAADFGFLTLIAPENRDLIKSNFDKHARGEDLDPYEYALITKGGKRIEAIITTRLINYEGERAILGIITDITERKRTEAEREALIAELEAKNAELERFTYTVSHDLKSPLITIQGFLGFLGQDAAKGDMERLRVDIQRIREATNMMHQLLNDLLKLSRIGRLVNPPQELPFGELAQQAVERVAGQIAKRGVQVTIAPNLPTVYGDRPRLVEVVQNLVDNGVKFMGDQPEPVIEIGSRQVGGEYVFYVRDNGIGIEPQYHEKVFGLFDRLDPSVEGTGVGLALVKRIIEVHGGRIWVELEGYGKGSSFCFTLPGKNTSPSKSDGYQDPGGGTQGQY